MSEVEKLYKNAGVEKQYYYFDSADGNTYTWELNENGNDKHNMCFIGKPKIKDREFTAEKQLELIKLLQRKNGYKFSFSSTNDNSEYLFFAHKDNTPVQELIVAGDKCYEEALAGFINILWQDLTEDERTEIKRILEL